MPAILLIFYRIYQVVISMSATVVATILPPSRWSWFGPRFQRMVGILSCKSSGRVCFCWLAFVVRVTMDGPREHRAQKETAICSWPTHQGRNLRHFTVYGYLGHNSAGDEAFFRKTPFVGWGMPLGKSRFLSAHSIACRHSPHNGAGRAPTEWRNVACGFPEGARTWTSEVRPLNAGPSALPWNLKSPRSYH